MARPLVSDAPTIRGSVSFSPREWAALDAEAERRDTTRSGLLRTLLRQLGVFEDAA